MFSIMELTIFKLLTDMKIHTRILILDQIKASQNFVPVQLYSYKPNMLNHYTKLYLLFNIQVNKIYLLTIVYGMLMRKRALFCEH